MSYSEVQLDNENATAVYHVEIKFYGSDFNFLINADIDHSSLPGSDGATKDAQIQEFVDFVNSTEGLELHGEQGYKNFNAWRNIIPE